MLFKFIIFVLSKGGSKLSSNNRGLLRGPCVQFDLKRFSDYGNIQIYIRRDRVYLDRKVKTIPIHSTDHTVNRSSRGGNTIGLFRSAEAPARHPWVA